MINLYEKYTFKNGWNKMLGKKFGKLEVEYLAFIFPFPTIICNIYVCKIVQLNNAQIYTLNITIFPIDFSHS